MEESVKDRVYCSLVQMMPEMGGGLVIGTKFQPSLAVAFDQSGEAVEKIAGLRCHGRWLYRMGSHPSSGNLHSLLETKGISTLVSWRSFSTLAVTG